MVSTYPQSGYPSFRALHWSSCRQPGIANLLSVLFILAFPFLQGHALRLSAWLSTLPDLLATSIILALYTTIHFGIGYYVRPGGMLCVINGLWRKQLCTRHLLQK